MAEAPPRITLPNPSPIRTVPVEFQVTEAGNICLDTGQYENLSLNMAEILRWVREARWRLDWYHVDALRDIE